jgi:hypothetical protein
MKNKETETVTIGKKLYDELVNDSKLLAFLEGAGVDNWDGWDYAMEEFNNAKDSEIQT